MLIVNACSTQVLGGQGAETAIMAFPCQVLDLVSATLGAAGYNRGVRAGCLRLL